MDVVLMLSSAAGVDVGAASGERLATSAFVAGSCERSNEKWKGCSSSNTGLMQECCTRHVVPGTSSASLHCIAPAGCGPVWGVRAYGRSSYLAGDCPRPPRVKASKNIHKLHHTQATFACRHSRERTVTYPIHLEHDS